MEEVVSRFPQAFFKDRLLFLCTGYLYSRGANFVMQPASTTWDKILFVLGSAWLGSAWLRRNPTKMEWIAHGSLFCLGALGAKIHYEMRSKENEDQE